jgi:hypothetical protein
VYGKCLSNPFLPKNRGSSSDFELSAGGGSKEFDSERGIGGSGGISLDVETQVEGMAKRQRES